MFTSPRAFLLAFFAVGSFVSVQPAPVLSQSVSQYVPVPRGVESDSFAMKARSKPIILAPVMAASWIVMDADSGRVLAGRDFDKRMFPASTTKTMTSLLAVESGMMDNTFQIGPYPPLVGEASVYLQKGERFVLRDLVKAALIRSANDSCVAIAEAVSGSSQRFAKKMNARARELGATRTRFVNPHGLHDAGHYTTARDLALIARRAMSLPEFARIARIRETSIHGNAKLGASRELFNRNRLLFRWASCDGVKTGYTRQAGHCLIASATQKAPDGKPWRLISVVMKSPDSQSDSYNALVHEGFERFAPQILARKNERFSLSTARGEVALKITREVRVPTRQGEQAQRSVIIERPLEGMTQGARVARAEWRAGDRRIAAAPLFLAQTPTLTEVAAPSAPLIGAPKVPVSVPSREDVERGFQSHRTGIGMALLIAALAMATAALRSLRHEKKLKN